MLQKNIDKQKRKERPKQWTGLYSRKTKTKSEKVKQIDKKEFEKVKRGVAQ